MGGWWWGKDPQTPVLKPSDEIPDPTPTPDEPPASTRELTDGNIPRHSADKEIEQEIQKLVDAADSTGQQAKRKFENVSNTARASLGLPPKSSSTSNGSWIPVEDVREHDDGTEHDHQHGSIYPETMSCRAAFDRAFYCNSLGGQMNNVYRYGGARDCKPNWAEFWFCMKLQSQDEASRRRKIRDWYIKKEAEVKMGPSSEDVWEVRREPLSRAFDKNPDRPDDIGRE